MIQYAMKSKRAFANFFLRDLRDQGLRLKLTKIPAGS